MENNKKRLTAPLTLFYSTDADLVEWLHSVPMGQRNGAVKNALRRGLGFKERFMLQSVAAAELERITGELDTLKSAVSRVPTMLKSVSSVAPAPDQIKRIEVIENDLDEINIYLQNFQRQLEQLAAAVSSGATISLPVNHQEAARLSDDEVSEIEANLLNNSW
jgi:hypothetical protein